MNNTAPRSIIQTIWENKLEIPFSDEIFFSCLSKDGGEDAKDLTKSDVSALLDGKTPYNWDAITFCFSETIFYYLVLAWKMSDQQIVGAAFAICVLADASRAYQADYEHNEIFTLCVILKYLSGRPPHSALACSLIERRHELRTTGFEQASPHAL